MVVAEQLDHRDARLVLERYCHLYPGASGQAAMALELYLQAATVGRRGVEVGSLTNPTHRTPCPTHGAYRDRTGDLRLAKPALSQLS
jgi:hypothetical protein